MSALTSASSTSSAYFVAELPPLDDPVVPLGNEGEPDSPANRCGFNNEVIPPTDEQLRLLKELLHEGDQPPISEWQLKLLHEMQHEQQASGSVSKDCPPPVSRTPTSPPPPPKPDPKPPTVVVPPSLPVAADLPADAGLPPRAPLDRVFGK